MLVLCCHAITTTEPAYAKKEASLCVGMKCGMMASAVGGGGYEEKCLGVCFPHPWQSAVEVADISNLSTLRANTAFLCPLSLCM